jgi:hypothetical protein
MVGTVYRVFGQIPMWTGYMKRGADEIYFTRAQDDTWVMGVNGRGDVVGYGIYGAGFMVRDLKRYLRAGSAAVTPKMFGIGYPDAIGTFPFAVNSQRIVVGSYMTVDGSLHGFVAAPNNRFEKEQAAGVTRAK